VNAEPLLDLAVDLAEDAGRLLLDYAQRRHLAVDTKTSATDPVSEADRASERLITDTLADTRPEDAILGEEDARNRPGTSGLRWVIDPLDGTVNFLYGIPAWCVSIACEDASGALVGVVHDPSRGETFAALRGGGATCNGLPIRASEVDRLDRALVATGFSYGPEVRMVQGGWAADLLGRARDIRRVGAAAVRRQRAHRGSAYRPGPAAADGAARPDPVPGAEAQPGGVSETAAIEPIARRQNGSGRSLRLSGLADSCPAATRSLKSRLGEHD
jgi:fructose-1,6-bisphosphatase/inositol monophosphatase family enzyme